MSTIHTTAETFNHSSDFSGNTPLPTDISLSTTIDGTTFTQHSADLEGLSARVKDLVSAVEEPSLNAPDIPFREVMAIAVIDQNDRMEVVATTSNSLNHIEESRAWSTLFSTSILDMLDAGEVPKHVVHIHTHPGPEYKPDHEQDTPVFISDADYIGYEKMSAFLSHYAEQEIPVLGLVRPVGQHCSNILFETSVCPPAHPNNDIQALMRDATNLKTQRYMRRAHAQQISMDL